MQNTENPQKNASFSPSSAAEQQSHHGAERFVPTENDIEDWKWIVEMKLRKELGVPAKWEAPEHKIEFHRRQLALLLDKANDAPRCAHVFADGKTCKAPRVKRGTLCYAHAQMEARSPKQMNLPPLEDANAVMIWIMEVSRSLLDGRISERTAGLMFYGLQLAMATAKHTTFKDTDPLEMVRTAPPICRELKARKKGEARMVIEPEIEDEEEPEDFDEPALTEELQVETELVEAEGEAIEEGNPGVESAKSIFSGVEVDGGEVEQGPAVPPKIPPAGEDVCISAQESKGGMRKSAAKPGVMLVHSGG